jgi:predicted alpha/beta hydrolase family esterase
MSPHPPEIFPPPHADSDAGLVLERTGTRGGQTSPVLVIPGLFNSGPDHWQSHLERTTPGAERVEQFDWERPTLGDWTASLVQLRGGRGIGGALLVSPADVNRDGPAGRLLTGFSPIPRLRFPFPSTVVASRNDPYVAFERAEAFARGWGSDLVDLGRAGHINVEAGYGPWPRARRLVDALIAKAERSPRADR